MDLATTTEKVQQILNSMVTQSEVWLEIIKAIKFHRKYEFKFNRKKFSFLTTADQASYDPGDGASTSHKGVPRTLLRIYPPLWRAPETGGSRHRIDELTDRELKVLEDYSDFEAALARFTDEGYALRTGRIYLAPTPTTEEVIEGEGLIEFSVPRTRFDGTTWHFYEPDGEDSLGGDWTSPWLDEGQDLIIHRVAHNLARDILKDRNVASEQQTAWLEELGEQQGARGKESRPRGRNWLVEF